MGYTKTYEYLVYGRASHFNGGSIQSSAYAHKQLLTTLRAANVRTRACARRFGASQRKPPCLVPVFYNFTQLCVLLATSEPSASQTF